MRLAAQGKAKAKAKAKPRGRRNHGHPQGGRLANSGSAQPVRIIQCDHLDSGQIGEKETETSLGRYGNQLDNIKKKKGVCV